jgi:V8-like Glu-specific endopeptidase
MILKIFIATIMLIALNTPLTMAVDLADIPLSIRQSVVQLSGSESCATGFIVGDQIVTNAHVTESLCPYGTCDPITVQIMDSTETNSWKFLTNQPGILIREVPSLDIALLKIPNIHKNAISPQEFLSASVGSDVTTLGFPGCQEFTVSEGKVLSKNILSFHTSALNSPGSSGSPIFDKQIKDPRSKTTGYSEEQRI